MLALTSQRPPKRTIYVPVIVDSGASGTLLPKEYLKLLGIKRADIVKDAVPAGGVKSKFVTWTSNVAIKAQIVIPTTPNPGGQVPQPAPWGPIFDLRPRFSARAPSLAGRSDFFQHFIIVFAEDQASPVFHIQVR